MDVGRLLGWASSFVRSLFLLALQDVVVVERRSCWCYLKENEKGCTNEKTHAYG